MDKEIRKKIKQELFKKDKDLAKHVEMQETNAHLEELKHKTESGNQSVVEAIKGLKPELQNTSSTTDKMVKFLEGMKGDKGDKGDRGEQGTQGIQGDKGEKGDEGLEGKQGEKGEQGSDGNDGFHGRDGRDGLNGSSDRPEDIAEKLNTLEEIVDYKVLKNIPTAENIVEAMRSLPVNKRLDISDIRNWNQPAKGKLDQRWHGSGGSGSGGDGDHKVLVSSTDTVANYLFPKLVAGVNVTLTQENIGSNEDIRIDVAGTPPGGNIYDVQINDGMGGFTGNDGFTYNTITGDVAISDTLSILEDNITPTAYTTFQGGDQSNIDITYTLPTALPISDKVLQSDPSGILSWVDGGGTQAGIVWTSRTSPIASTLLAVTYGNGMFVVTGNTGTPEDHIITSPDGVNWTDHVLTTTNSYIDSVTYGNGLFVAISQNSTIVNISPDGINWTAHDTLLGSGWTSVTYGKGVFVAVTFDGSGAVMTSLNGIDWLLGTAASTEQWAAITYGDNQFVAVGQDGSGNDVMTSPDGITWTLQTNPAGSYYAITYAKGQYIAVGAGGIMMTSPDAVTWTSQTSGVINDLSSITYGEGLYISASYAGDIITSPDGVTWTTRTNPADSWYALAYGNGVFVVVSAIGTIASSGAEVFNAPSPNNIYQGGMTVRGKGNEGATLQVEGNLIQSGIEWTEQMFLQNGPLGIAYGNGTYVVVGDAQTGTDVMTSPDGVNWTLRSEPVLNLWYSVVYGAGLFAAVSLDGTGNQIMTSPDGITWTPRVNPIDSVWVSIAYGNATFVAVSLSGDVMTSFDGINWTQRTAASVNQWSSIVYGNNQFVVVSNDNTGTTMTSPDGINWSAGSSMTPNTWNAVTYGNGLYVAVSNSGFPLQVSTSSDLNDWTDQTAASDNAWAAIAYGDGLFVATAYNPNTGTGSNIMTSVDGIVWTSRPYTAPVDAQLNSLDAVIYANSQFVVVGEGGNVFTSTKELLNVIPDNNVFQGGRTVRGISPSGSTLEVGGDVVSAGTTWETIDSLLLDSWDAVAYGDGQFVAVSQDDGGIGVMTSPDGRIWTAQTPAAFNSWRDIVYGNGLFAAVSADGFPTQVMTSPDGINWTLRTAGDGSAYTGIAYGNGTFVIITDSLAYTSPDGITWTQQVMPSVTWVKVTYGDGQFVAISSDASGTDITTSPDGITWTLQTTPEIEGHGITYANGLFVGVGTGTGSVPLIITSPDGVTWTPIILNPDFSIDFRGITYGQGLFVAISADGDPFSIFTSPDGVIWTGRDAIQEQWEGIAYGNGVFVMVQAGFGDSLISISGKEIVNTPPTYNIHQGDHTFTNKLTVLGPIDPTYVEFTQISTPSTPDSGKDRLYFKSDDNLYKKISTGIETQIGSGDFSGPSSATDNAVVRFDGTTGKLGQNSGLLVNDIISKNAILDLSLLASTDKTFTFPNQTGTFALVANVVALTGNQSISGVKTFTTDYPVGPGATPTISTQLVDKQYVDTVATTGTRFVNSLIASTTTTLPANTYTNGASGIGAKLTGNSNGAISAQDGVTLVLNDTLLVKDEATQSHNGAYLLTRVGTAGTTYVLTRTTDYDTSSEITVGTFFSVLNGTSNANTLWVMNNNSVVTVGTTAITFAKLSNFPTFTASLGVKKVALDFEADLLSTGAIILSGNSMLVNTDNSSIEISTNALRVKALGVTNAMLAGSIADTKLLTISTAGKVSGAALTSLPSIPSGAGLIPTANLGTGSATTGTFLRGDQSWQAIPGGSGGSNTLNYTKVLGTDGTVTTISNSAAQTTIYSFSVPGNTLSTNKFLKLELDGTYLQNSGANRTANIQVGYGTTTLINVSTGNLGASATTGNWIYYISLDANGATNAQVASLRGYHVTGSGNIVTVNSVGASAIDSTLSQNLTVKTTLSSATATQTYTRKVGVLRMENATDLVGIPTTRQINTTTPLQGGGNLSTDLTLSVLQANLSGTANQVILSASGTGVLLGSTNITLSLPQDIATSSTPSFAGVIATNTGNPVFDTDAQIYEPGGGLFIDTNDNVFYPFSSGASLWVDDNGNTFYADGVTIALSTSNEINYGDGSILANSSTLYYPGAAQSLATTDTLFYPDGTHPLITPSLELQTIANFLFIDSTGNLIYPSGTEQIMYNIGTETLNYPGGGLPLAQSGLLYYVDGSTVAFDNSNGLHVPALLYDSSDSAGSSGNIPINNGSGFTWTSPTVGGILTNVGKAQLTGQTAAISPTTLFTAPAAGEYLVTAYYAIAAVGTGHLEVEIDFDDGISGEDFSAPHLSFVSGTAAQFTCNIHLANGAGVAYATAMVGVTGGETYTLYVNVIRLS